MKRVLPVVVALIVGLCAGSILGGTKETVRGKSPPAVTLREGDSVNLSGHGAGVESQFHRLKVVPQGESNPNVKGEWIVTIGPPEDSQVVYLTAR